MFPGRVQSLVISVYIQQLFFNKLAWHVNMFFLIRETVSFVCVYTACQHIFPGQVYLACRQLSYINIAQYTEKQVQNISNHI